MYNDIIEHFANLARNKADTLLHRPLAFLTGALTAGVYVGIGIRAPTSTQPLRAGNPNDAKPLRRREMPRTILSTYASLKP